MRADSLEKSIMLEVISRKRRRGNPSTCWLDTIKDNTIKDDHGGSKGGSAKQRDMENANP